MSECDMCCQGNPLS